MSPSRPSPLSIAALSGLVLWAIARAGGLDRIAAPGLWPMIERIGMGATLAPLFAIGVAGAATTALVQPLAHPGRARPWQAGIALALLLVPLALPVPAALLLALLPVAVAAGVGVPIALALVAAVTLPPLGMAALTIAAWRLARTLRLPFAVNDNQRSVGIRQD